MFKTSIHSGVFAMVGGLIIVPIVSWFTPKMKKESVDKIFEWYDEKVTVSKKVSLAD